MELQIVFSYLTSAMLGIICGILLSLVAWPFRGTPKWEKMIFSLLLGGTIGNILAINLAAFVIFPLMKVETPSLAPLFVEIMFGYLTIFTFATVIDQISKQHS